MKHNRLTLILFAGLVLTVAGCNSGGGSSSSAPGTGAASASGSATTVGAVSSGPITAFGSVFVNGHEFYTVGAAVVDDDTGTTSTSTSGLEVGEMVDVVPASNSTPADPIAAELHIDPLARGYVDASDTTAGTVTIMGQTVQITSNTVFSDHRACAATAAANPCTAVTGQSGLTATTGSGQTAVPGSYVKVYGYLFAPDNSSGTANIVASLVSVSDAPNQTSAPVNFKAEGVVTAVASGTITIGGLTVDLSNARCFTRGRPHTGQQPLSCDSAFSAGQIVSTFGATAPSLPATAFTADGARLNKRIPVANAGATVELDGPVASVTSSPAAFVVRGITVDASQLPSGTSLPAVGDIVRVLGTVAADGQSITASDVTILHTAFRASYGFEGDVGGIAAGTAADTYALTLLGQNILVTADTRLADRSTAPRHRQDPPLNPFNITTFQSYLRASASQHVVVYASADASGNLTAQSVIIVRPSTTAGAAGIVDASPAPVNGTQGGGTPTTFSVHGVPVSADPAAVLGYSDGHEAPSHTATVKAGDEVTALGRFDGTTLTITAPPSFNNEVIDRGVPQRRDLDEF